MLPRNNTNLRIGRKSLRVNAHVMYGVYSSRGCRSFECVRMLRHHSGKLLSDHPLLLVFVHHPLPTPQCWTTPAMVQQCASASTIATFAARWWAAGLSWALKRLLPLHSKSNYLCNETRVHFGIIPFLGHSMIKTRQALLAFCASNT